MKLHLLCNVLATCQIEPISKVSGQYGPVQVITLIFQVCFQQVHRPFNGARFSNPALNPFEHDRDTCLHGRKGDFGSQAAEHV